MCYGVMVNYITIGTAQVQSEKGRRGNKGKFEEVQG